MEAKDNFAQMMLIIYQQSNMPFEVFHYTDAADKILLEDSKGVSLRMTHIDCFDDVFEGKTIEVFYDLALEDL